MGWMSSPATDGMDVLFCHCFKIRVEITTPLPSPPNSPNCQEALRAAEILPDVYHVCGLSPFLSCKPRSDAYHQKKVRSTRKVHAAEGSLRRVSSDTTAEQPMSLLLPSPRCWVRALPAAGAKRRAAPQSDRGGDILPVARHHMLQRSC